MTTALITGCGSGFGRLAALDLARQGVRVIATVRRLESAVALRETADSESLALSVLVLDVTDTHSIDRVIEEVVADGSIDILINNAGYAQRGPLETLTDEEISRQFDTNVTGVLRMVRAVTPHMRRSGRGVIINISSLSGHVGIPFEGLYSASKHALEGLSQALSYELAPAGISVRVIVPGAYETGFVSGASEASAFSDSHPLWEEYHRFWEAAAGLTGGDRQDPAAVVAAIRSAALDPSTPYCTLVGEDAEFAVNARLDARLDDFAPTIREVLGLSS